MKFLSILLLISLSLSAFSRELSKEQKLNDLNELVAMIKAGYGPLEYKKNNFGIDIDTLYRDFSLKIANSKNNSQFYYLIVQFVAAFNDSHFGARIPTDHRATLGFRTDLINGKVLIESIDEQLLPASKFPFKKGDEIISLNTQPVEKVINSLLPYMGQGTPLTAKRMAASLLTRRFGSLSPIPSGKASLQIRKGSSNFIEEIELEWILKGTPLDEYEAPTSKNNSNFANLNYEDLSIIKDESFEGSFRCSGSTRTKIPKKAVIIMEKPFVAYYHKTKKGNIGYLRLPHYSPKESNSSINAFDLRFSQYEYAVSELEKNTVGLIIDQDHNCGGSVSYLHRILSLFAKKPFAPVQFELLANKQSYLGFKSWMDQASKYTLDYKKSETVVELIKDTWLNKKSFLTTKTSLSGREFIQPNIVRYTKPIIVLIDENSGSGGDAFPAMMQGLGRAKLLGTQTMGAGGHVIKLPELSNSQISVRMTKSLFYHPNTIAIENNGASPDIKYRPTRDDFMYEYRGYQQFYLNELFKILK